MKALWALGEGTVHTLRAQLLPERSLAYTTVMTVMNRLASKGVVEREKRGRAHVYRPKFTEQQARESAIEKLADNFFRGSREDLSKHLNPRAERTAARAVPLPPPSTEAADSRPRRREVVAEAPASLDESLL